MHQLTQSEKFVIARQLDDSADGTTYYVQAVIQDLLEESTIETVNLTDQGNQRFTGQWLVTKDRIGTGTYISITVKVYTDSGYTTLSDVYAAEIESYVIQDRWSYALGSATGGVGGVDIDYKRITAIIKKEIEKRPVHAHDNSNVLRALESIKRLVSEIPNEFVEIPKVPETDLKPVMEEVKRVQKELVRAVSTLGGVLRADIQKAVDSIEINPIRTRISSEDKKELAEDVAELVTNSEVQDAKKEALSKLSDAVKNVEGVNVNAGKGAKLPERKTEVRPGEKRRLGDFLRRPK